MALLGYMDPEDIPLFGDLLDIEPVSCDESSVAQVQQAAGYGLQEKNCFNSGYGPEKAANLGDVLPPSDWNYGSLSGLWSDMPEALLPNSPVGAPAVIDDSLASILSLLDGEVFPPTQAVTELPLEATQSFINSPASTEEWSSHSGYSPAPEVDTDPATSPFSLGDSESASGSPPPSNLFNDNFGGLFNTSFQEFEPCSGDYTYADDSSFDDLYESVSTAKKFKHGKSPRQKPYTTQKKGFRLEELEPCERVQRKKEQNKTAASRYRQKKKAEKSGIDGECFELEDRNRELKDQVVGLSREIQYLKGLMKEVMQAKKMKNSKGKK